jgi:hypothetical protein
MSKSLRPLLAVVSVVIGLLALSSSAMAAAPTGDYADFKYCPYTNTAVTSCVISKTSGGSFQLGNTTVPINKTITLQGGFSQDTGAWYNAVGADTLSKTPLDVPGGLLGLMDLSGGPLAALFNAAVHSVNGVTATAELVGPVQFSFLNFVILNGPAIVLPVRIHLENPFLGSNCYIGSSSHPVTLSLTTGTTAPPAPNRPISGDLGSFTYNSDFTVATDSGNKLVDNAFSVPAASGCGFTPIDQLLITAAVNLREGFPSAAGKNTAILQGTTKIGDRGPVAASVH